VRGWGVSTVSMRKASTIRSTPNPTTNHTHNIRMRVWVLAGSLITESQEH